VALTHTVWTIHIESIIRIYKTKSHIPKYIGIGYVLVEKSQYVKLSMFISRYNEHIIMNSSKTNTGWAVAKD